MRPILVLFIFFCTTIYPQIVDKVLISGLAGFESHDLDVKRAFEDGYSSYDGSIFPGEITLLAESMYSSFSHAKNNGYKMLIRSTTGLSSGIYYSNYFPTVKLIMPSGSNDFQLTYNGDIETCPVIVTGAGEFENTTGYKIDFYSIDPITESNLSSFSNGFIAGQLAYIANMLDCSIEEARIFAREKGTQNGVWDFYNGYGKVEIGSVLESPFPVELSSFTANVSSNMVELNWKTETEIENYGFEIERASYKLLDTELVWQTIGFKPGNGNSNIPINYNYIDIENLVEGEYLYRLKQIDNDGKFEYSKNIVVNITSPYGFSLSQNYPNPFNPETNIEFNLAEEGETKLVIFDILGNKISEYMNSFLPAGKHSVKINGSNLSAGTYIYQLETFDSDQKSVNIETKKMTLLK